MSGAHRRGTSRAGRKTGACRAFEEGRGGREAAHLSEHQLGRENTAEANQAAGGDEILRTERGGGKGRHAVDGPAPVHGQGTYSRADDGKRFPGPGLTASGVADETYRGWLPTGALLTPGEVLAAVLVAEIGWGVAMLVLALAERLAELPELVAEHGFASTFLFALICGLYTLVCLRSRRLAWRKHLGGAVTPAWPRHRKGREDSFEDR
jgi:hypothetical protein